MKNIVSLALCLLVLVQNGLSFVPRLVVVRRLPFLHAVTLEPEPDGGQELTATSTLPGCRMKQMDQIKENSDNGPVYKFWMTAEVDGALIKELRTQILKDASKKANFPGFRKGQVPPWAQGEITQFSLQEAIIKTVEAAVEAYGLKSLPGSEGEVNVNEDVKEMSKGYKKIGESVQFTATLDACYDPERTSEDSSDDAADTVVDVEAQEAS